MCFYNLDNIRDMHVGNLMLTLVAVVLIVACERHTLAWEQMDVAESIMNTKPDSALAILEGIPASDVKGKETAARYALLKSMALDKNYIDTTTFDILQPAIDYYIKKGTPDEQLSTYYYQGRIYQNRGDDDAAMSSFMNACDLRQKVSDSLLLAHTLVAQGTLYLKQYKVKDFIHNNMEAAKLYGAIGRNLFEIKSYTNALDGYVMQNNKSAADSLMSVCTSLVQKNPDGEVYLFHSLLSYTVNFDSQEDIKKFLSEYQDMELSTDDAMNFAQGYSKIGEYDKAMSILSKISLDNYSVDSLKYISTKIDVLEKQGEYKQALMAYKDYSAMLESYQYGLLSHDLLFAEKKHQLEMDNIKDIQNRDRIIWGTLCSILVLLLIVGWLYYRAYLNKMEAANLRLEISQLESELDNLKELQKEQSELAQPVQDVIKDRLDMLNCLLAKEITQNESYAKPYDKWIESVRNDKNKFMDSTRLALTASHPKFIGYLEQHGLSTEEINYLCLYAIGLRGKEVGEYIQLKRHYNISSEIRRKLGIDEHETNIGLYVRKLMKGVN